VTSNQAVVLECRQLILTLLQDGAALKIVDGFDCRIHRGEFFALVGESGSGKTMIARAVMRLMQPTRLKIEGTMRFLDVDLARAGTRQMQALRGARISMIFQEPMTSLNPIMTVGKQTAEAILARRRLSKSRVQERIEELFAAVRLPDPAHVARLYPYELSGGMRQRVLIAIALANEPDLLIADEPTTALDVTTQKDILDIIARRQREAGLSVLYISHDLALVSRYADTVGVLYAGVLMEQGATREVIQSPAHPYTAALLACLPGPRLDGERKREIRGAVARAGEWQEGCCFAARCEQAAPQCRTGVIAMRRVQARSVRCLTPRA
jgi:peptide/nickel transport system ATP-binding protein